MVKRKVLLKILLVRRMRARRIATKRKGYMRDVLRRREFYGERYLVEDLAHDEEYHHRYFRYVIKYALLVTRHFRSR
jgi:hypothetical protein